jgi:hypothetical protein
MKYYTTTTEFNCGIDLHARQMYVCVMDRQGKVLLHTNIEGNDFELLPQAGGALAARSDGGLRMHVQLVLAGRCLRRGGDQVCPGPCPLRRPHPRRQEQERPHRLGKARPPASEQPHSRRLTVIRPRSARFGRSCASA